MTLDEAIRQHIKDRRKPKRKVKNISNVERIKKIDQERLRAAAYDDNDKPF